jgi:arsenite methyltransferase
MEPMNHDEIRQSVRNAYEKVATATSPPTGTSRGASCCDPTDDSAVVSCGCNESSLALTQMSSAMGYNEADINSVPEGSNMGLGCGNPVAIASIKPGETVVDLGSGGGFDCFLAAQKVGQTGHVIGVDMTSEMVSKARKNTLKRGLENVEFRLGEIENLPVGDNLADIIISNCVVNLSPDKLAVYRDAYRILKPGGRIAISDILTTAPLPEEIKKDLQLLAACMGGAQTFAETEQILRKAGFTNISIKSRNISGEILREWTPATSEDVTDYIVSVTIEALKRA